MDQISPASEETMRAELAKARQFTLVVLSRGPNYGTEGSQAIVWQHGRRNMALRLSGTMPLVGPVAGGDSGIIGICVFDTTGDEARAIMDGDPGVQAGLFTYAVYPWTSFPGDRLPAVQGE
jgi:uncharacterized protein YciI